MGIARSRGDLGLGDEVGLGPKKAGNVIALIGTDNLRFFFSLGSNNVGGSGSGGGCGGSDSYKGLGDVCGDVDGDVPGEWYNDFDAVDLGKNNGIEC